MLKAADSFIMSEAIQIVFEVPWEPSFEPREKSAVGQWTACNAP